MKPHKAVRRRTRKNSKNSSVPSVSLRGLEEVRLRARVVKTAPRLNQEAPRDKVKTDALLFENRIGFLSIHDVAQWLGYSVGTLYNLTSQNLIPHRKKRGKLYFDPGEIQNWIDEGDLK